MSEPAASPSEAPTEKKERVFLKVTASTWTAAKSFKLAPTTSLANLARALGPGRLLRNGENVDMESTPTDLGMQCGSSNAEKLVFIPEGQEDDASASPPSDQPAWAQTPSNQPSNQKRNDSDTPSQQSEGTAKSGSIASRPKPPPKNRASPKEHQPPPVDANDNDPPTQQPSTQSTETRQQQQRKSPVNNDRPPTPQRQPPQQQQQSPQQQQRASANAAPVVSRKAPPPSSAPPPPPPPPPQQQQQTPQQSRRDGSVATPPPQQPPSQQQHHHQSLRPATPLQQPSTSNIPNTTTADSYLLPSTLSAGPGRHRRVAQDPHVGGANASLRPMATPANGNGGGGGGLPPPPSSASALRLPIRDPPSPQHLTQQKGFPLGRPDVVAPAAHYANNGLYRTPPRDTHAEVPPPPNLPAHQHQLQQQPSMEQGSVLLQDQSTGVWYSVSAANAVPPPPQQQSFPVQNDQFNSDNGHHQGYYQPSQQPHRDYNPSLPPKNTLAGPMHPHAAPPHRFHPHHHYPPHMFQSMSNAHQQQPSAAQGFYTDQSSSPGGMQIVTVSPPRPQQQQSAAETVPLTTFQSLERQVRGLKDDLEVAREELEKERAHREMTDLNVKRLVSIVAQQRQDHQAAMAEDEAVKEHQLMMQQLKAKRGRSM